MASSDSRQGPKGDGQPRDPLAGFPPPADPPLPDLSGLYGDLERQIADERGARAWLRSRSTPARLAIAGTSLLAVFAVTVLVGLRPDHAVYPIGRMVAVLLFIALLVAADLLLALWPLQRATPPRWLHVTAIAGALAGLIAVYALPAAHESHPASRHAPGLDLLVQSAVRCLGLGLLLALAVYALVRALDRGGERRALLAAACSGFAANFALQLHCPVTLPAHMLVGHLGVAVLFVAAVALYTRGRG